MINYTSESPDKHLIAPMKRIFQILQQLNFHLIAEISIVALWYPEAVKTRGIKNPSMNYLQCHLSLLHIVGWRRAQKILKETY